MAVATAVSTYILLLAGGLVHSTGSGLACPDWPLCFGQFFPPMVGNIRFEHSHRLIAAAVGLLTLVTAALVWKRERKAILPIAVAAISLVGIQIVLGGITVMMRLPDIVSTAHLAVGSAFFAVLVLLCVKTSSADSARAVEIDGRARAWIIASASVVFFQMVLGAFVRHSESGLACPDVPACRGEWILSVSTPQGLQMLHRYTAVAVFAVAAAMFWSTRLIPRVRGWALAAFALVTAQAAVGILAVTSQLSLLSVMAHLGLAELLWAVLIILLATTTAARQSAALSPAFMEA